MHFGKRRGYGAYPIFALALLLAPAGLLAQSTADQQTTQTTGAQAQPAPQGTQERAEVLRQAQERVKARRKLRLQQVIQDTYTHQYEVYGGGGYLRFTPGSSLQHLNEAAWNAGFTDYIKGKIGITADFRGYYGTAFTYINQYQVFNPSISQYTFMAGPQVRLVERLHWGISANALVGAGHGNFSTNTGAAWHIDRSVSRRNGVQPEHRSTDRLQPGTDLRDPDLAELPDDQLWQLDPEQSGLECRGGLEVWQAVALNDLIE